MFNQDEQTVNKLIAIYDALEDWREIEMERASSKAKSDNK